MSAAARSAPGLLAAGVLLSRTAVAQARPARPPEAASPDGALVVTVRTGPMRTCHQPAMYATVGGSIIIARRRGSIWFIGGLTNWTPRDVEMDPSFLGEGRFDLERHRGGPNGHRIGVDCVRERRRVTGGDRLRFHRAPGGGVAGRLDPAR
ncbi:MAG TPA: glycoside hydrolase family 97 C-terminal domain-containing protein [Vicinamibacterales bacterium]|nr:glycoside hydrolase family 97 C-terminal domain-containing protein [Vicinamibacterales bacterium]